MRTQQRHDERHTVDHHPVLHRVEEWVEETGLAPADEPEEGVPWHAVVFVIAALGLLAAAEMTLVFVIAELVTGHAY